jgi:hypothetical protein
MLSASRLVEVEHTNFKKTKRKLRGVKKKNTVQPIRAHVLKSTIEKAEYT